MMPRKPVVAARARSSVTDYEALDATPDGHELTLRHLARRPPLIVGPDEPLRDVLFAINQAGVQAAVVAEESDRVLGIVTLRDLIDAITISRVDLSEPAFAHMTAAPISLPADASVHRARVAMTRGGLSYLVLLEADGQLNNLLSPLDLPGYRERGADQLLDAINQAGSAESMASVAADARRRGRELFDAGLSAETLSQWMSGLNDLIGMRVIEMVADEYDLPPVPWCWLVFGSEGRLEQTFASDQDNGLIFQPEREEDTEALREQFLPFAQAVNRALDLCGFMLCPGEIMAGNPRWCLSVSEWQQRFGQWISVPEPEALLNATIFFDFRPLYGQDELADDLRKWLLPMPDAHPRFLQLLAEQALTCPPSLGLFGNFSYDGGREHPHTIDIKSRGSRPIVDAARIWALQQGIWSTNTFERLRAIGPKLKRTATDTAAAVEAFDLVQRIRIQRQLSGGDYRAINRVDPSELTAAQQMMLKEAFKQIKVLQLGLRQQFGI